MRRYSQKCKTFGTVCTEINLPCIRFKNGCPKNFKNKNKKKIWVRPNMVCHSNDSLVSVHTMKAYAQVEVYLHLFLTSAALLMSKVPAVPSDKGV
jgi:hypothetical protein